MQGARKNISRRVSVRDILYKPPACFGNAYTPENKTSLRTCRNASDKNNFFAVKKLTIGRFERRKTALITAISDSLYG